MRAGIPVPPGFAVTTDAFREMLATGGVGRRVAALLEEADPDDVAGVEQISLTVRELIEHTPIPNEVQSAIRTAYTDMWCRYRPPETHREQPAAIPVAVRSSATAEDLPGASFAGQQDTFLWVVGIDAVLENVRRCWSSLYSARAIVYRLEKGFGDAAVYMSACVQKMVDARVAGVMFTLNPVNGDRSKIVIEASWGLGEAVAAGEVTPDNYLVDKITRRPVRRTISEKLVEYRPNHAERRVERRQVPAARRQAACLDDAGIAALVGHARAIEAHFGRPQDLEWALDADLAPPDDIVLLQSRPETVWSTGERRQITDGGASTLEQIVANLVTGVRIRPSRSDEGADGE